MANKTALQLLPYLQPSQAQKHVTYNSAIQLLDVLVQTSAISRSLTTPPVSPLAGDCYIVAVGASGDWLGEDKAVAVYNGSYWDFYLPKTGWRVWLQSESMEAVFDGTAWTTSAERPDRVARLGIATDSDDTNRLSLSSNASLFNHAGGGHQIKVNKAASGQTASLLFQTGFSGRAEMGTVGNDDFALKVSADGTTFLSALTVEAATGRVIAGRAMRILPVAGDVPSPANGDIWYNLTTGKLRMRQNGVTVNIVDLASGAEQAANKGAVNGYAALDAAGKVPATQLPSYVDDVLEVATFAALPATGEAGKIYVTLNTNKTYRWSGTAYVDISAGPGNTDALVEGTSNLYHTNARAIGATLTGFAPAASRSAIVATDSILVAMQKMQKLQADMANIAFTGAFADLAARPTNLSGYGITDAVDTSTNQTVAGAKTFSNLNNNYSAGTGNGTTNYSSGATTSGNTKTVNIGAGGLSGSTTNINIGPTNAGANSTLTLNSATINTGAAVTAMNLTDSALTIVEQADSTKKAKFSASGLTTGTTRTFALPDASGTLALNTPFSASAAGLVPASGGGTANYLRADGTWAPAGGSASWSALSGMPSAIDAIDGLTPAANRIAYYTGTTTAALAPITAFGRSLLADADAQAAREGLEVQGFATRAELVTWAAGAVPVVGQVRRAAGYDYRYIGSGTAIGDLPGWVPQGMATAAHFGVDLTGTVSAIAAVSALIDYVSGQGGGIARLPAGTYRWDGNLQKQGLQRVILEGEGNQTKLIRTGNQVAAAIRFWGGSNNRIRRIFIDCAGYTGRGFFLQDQWSGIEDCECNNCPDRPFGMQGGGNTSWGLDSNGRTSDDAAFTTATFFPQGCWIERCRATRAGNTAFSQKQMHHSRITACIARQTYTEGVTIDKCDYSVVSECVLLDVGLIDTQQFPNLVDGGFLAAGGGGVGGVGIDGSTGARFVKNTIIGVHTNLAARNNRNKAAINVVNNIQSTVGCQIEGNFIADAKAGIWLKGVVSGAAADSNRNILADNVFQSMGTAAGTGLAQYGAIWIDAGCADNVVSGNLQIGGVPRITGPVAQNAVDVAEAGLNWLVPDAGEYMMTTMGGGSATGSLAGGANRMDLFPFIARTQTAVTGVAINVVTAVASAQAKVLIYESDAQGRPDALVLESDPLDCSIAGVRAVDATVTLRQGKTYWVGIRHSSNATLSTWSGSSTPDINGGAPATTARKVLRRSLAFATAAPANWGWSSGEINAANPTAIWLKA